VAANAKWNLTRLSVDPAQAQSVATHNAIAGDVGMVLGVPSQLLNIPGSDAYQNMSALVGLLQNTVLPGYIGLLTAWLNQALMSSGARIEADVENVPAMAEFRREPTKTAIDARILSVNEMRQMIGYPVFEDGEDEDADVPVLLLEARLKRLALEIQGGNLANILSPEDR
jgi:phage portal protein BeeE